MPENAVYNQMKNKQKETLILPKESFINLYQEFIIDKTEDVGDYIVENAVDELTAQGADTSIFDGERPSIAEVSYNTRRTENYIYKLRQDELKKVANSKTAYDGLVAKIEANLDEQDRKDCYRQFPKVISNTSGLVKEGQIVYDTSATNYAQIILDMKADIAKLGQPTDDYNAYEKVVMETTTASPVTPVEVTKTLKTFAYDPIIFIRGDLKASLEVNFLSGVYNLDKVGLGARIIEVPTFYKMGNDGKVSDEEDKNILWLTCGKEYAKIYKDFEKRVYFEDMRSSYKGKAVTYIEFVSKLVPAIMHRSDSKPEVEEASLLKARRAIK